MSVPTTGVDAPPVAEQPASTRHERVGWYFYDWANSAFSTTVISVFLGPYLTSVAEKAAGCDTSANAPDCNTPLFHVFGTQVLPGSVYPYAVALSVVLEGLVQPAT